MEMETIRKHFEMFRKHFRNEEPFFLLQRIARVARFVTEAIASCASFCLIEVASTSPVQGATGAPQT